MSKILIHASTVARQIDGEWRGVLLLGPSGAGKSDLALRAVTAGFSWVSDDYTVVFNSENRAFATAPDTIKGRYEVRGLGIFSTPSLGVAPIYMAAFLQSHAPERLPEKEVTEILGFRIPTIRLIGHEASSVAKLDLALRQIVTGTKF